MGNTALMQQLGVDAAPLATETEALRVQGASVMHLAVDKALAMSLSSASVIGNALRLRGAVIREG